MKGNYHYDKIYLAIQDLEEIWGPDTVTEYVRILTAVKKEIDKRIDTAVANALDTSKGLRSREEVLDYFREKCGPHLDPDIDSISNEDLKERFELAIKEESL